MQDAFNFKKVSEQKESEDHSFSALQAIKLAQQIHGNLSDSTALIVGAGQTTTLVASSSLTLT